jgi:hypothetical protein
MSAGEFVYTGAALLFSSITVILAIALWARTREESWFYVFLGVISLYAGIVHAFLLRLGVITSIILIDTVPLLSIVFAVLPWLFLSAAFLIVLIRRTRP